MSKLKTYVDLLWGLVGGSSSNGTYISLPAVPAGGSTPSGGVIPPSDLAASNVGAASLDLSWTINDPNALSTRVFNGPTLIADLPAPTAVYPVTGLTQNTAYTFTIDTLVASVNVSVNVTTNVVTGYNYGYPTAQSPEPNVVAQWLFNAASEPITDVVGGIKLNHAFANPTYNVAASGLYAPMTPGVRFLGYAVYTGLGNASPQTSLDIAVGQDSVLEIVAEVDGANTSGWMLGTKFNGLGPGISILQQGIAVLRMHITDAYGNYFYGSSGDLSAYADGKLHKFRLVIDRSGAATAVLNLDGMPIISLNIATATDVIPCKQVLFGTNRMGNDYPWYGRMNEARWTVGNKTNNSGGPNGG